MAIRLETVAQLALRCFIILRIKGQKVCDNASLEKESNKKLNHFAITRLNN
jgi:hypothetical protein